MDSKMRALFQEDLVSAPFIGAICWGTVYQLEESLPHKYLQTNEVQDVSFKLIHRFSPVKHLQKFRNDRYKMFLLQNSSDTCSLLFWYCEFTHEL